MVATWKKKTVEGIAKDISSAKTVAIIGVTGIPSKQFQQIRKKLKKDIKLRMVKNSIIKLALEKAKVQALGEHIKGPSGILTTNLNPFKLSKLISSCRTKAPAKAGSIAPCDIIVPKGDTPFPAGPVIGDVQKAGIKAKIQGGKIVVTEDSVVVKQGKPVPADSVGILARLGITPFEIGIDLNAAYEEGVVYSGDILSIDDKSTKDKIVKAYHNAFNFAYNAKVYTQDTVKLFLKEGHSQALSLSYNAKVVNKETVNYYLAKANQEAAVLKAKIPETVEEPKA